MMKSAIPAILLVLVSQGKKTSDTSIVGIETIPRAIPKSIRNEKNEKKDQTGEHTRLSVKSAELEFIQND